MSRTPLDPSLLGDDAQDHALLDAWIARLRPAADALAMQVFLREVVDAMTAPAEHALRSIARDPGSLRSEPARDALAKQVAATLRPDEREGVRAHGEEIADALGRAWVDLWHTAVSTSDGALRVGAATPDDAALHRAWSETAELLGLSRAEADGLVLEACAAMHRAGETVALPLGLSLDARASDLWMHRTGEAGALPEEIARSGAQLRGPAASLDEARRRRGG
jgi:hypothetical protein